MTGWLDGARRAADDGDHAAAQSNALISIAETLVALVGLIEMSAVEVPDGDNPNL